MWWSDLKNPVITRRDMSTSPPSLAISYTLAACARARVARIRECVPTEQ